MSVTAVTPVGTPEMLPPGIPSIPVCVEPPTGAGEVLPLVERATNGLEDVFNEALICAMVTPASRALAIAVSTSLAVSAAASSCSRVASAAAIDSADSVTSSANTDSGDSAWAAIRPRAREQTLIVFFIIFLI